MEKESTKEIVKELDSIKKLLIAQLILSGLNRETIGKILGVTGRTINNIVPISDIRQKNEKIKP